MTDLPLLPKATAVWLVDNTTLTFTQIAEFTGMHDLEIAGIADGEVAIGIKGIDPITGGQLTREEITARFKDQIAGYKRPRYIEFVDQLPRDMLGKLQRLELSQRPVTPDQAA